MGAEDLPKWREDFPYESEGDDHVTRRDFARFLVLLSGGLATGNAVVYLRSRRPPAEPSGRMEIARVGDLAPGSAVVFRYPDETTPALLIRRESGELLAFEQKCSHLGCPVSYAREGGEECLRCYCHNGRFDVASGEGTSGPPRDLRPLGRIALEVEGGKVFAVGLSRGRAT
ncbi:QcrA and Rieske domain-containing protein [Sorangium atrum]|uniref:Rieske (2Fe-2S) protein n=1 Tax=Sorangium atrum TaxID=2995308 RepID=A0ABT5BUR0_9BACT|nr:Rieske (2Fe-2S) protein [Sorangium aterium]MDC0677893.1 Rieske (2Fe-2S) protein [Sorangium aterium]